MPLLNTVCTTCTGLFSNSNDVYSTSCGHLFHYDCIIDWQRRVTSCPQCGYYNPSTHKLFLSFDESSENYARQEESINKLKASNEKITQLRVEINETEANFFQLQEQYTSVEKTKKQLEENIKQMNQSEENFMSLQNQFTQSSEMTKQLEDRIKKLMIENEYMTKKMGIRVAENESLKNGVESGQNMLNNSSLAQRLYILEQKLKKISIELEKEITLSTQLAIEKMKLQSYVNYLESDNNNTEKITQSQNNRKGFKQNRKENVIRDPSINQNDREGNRSILIQELPKHLIVLPLENVIINLAKLMNMSLTAQDLDKLNFVGNTGLNSAKSKLHVQFKSITLKEQFLAKKILLKKDPCWKTLIITEFLEEEILELYKYAREKLRYYCIFANNNKIFARKDRKSGKVIHIESKLHVDKLRNNKIPDEAIANSENSNRAKGIDENYYQLP